MNEHANADQEISVDLSKLPGFQTLSMPADCADLGKLMDDTHNKSAHRRSGAGSARKRAAKQKLRAVPDCNAIGHGSRSGKPSQARSTSATGAEIRRFSGARSAEAKTGSA